MTASSVLALSGLLLLMGAALFGFAAIQAQRQRQQQVRVVDRALQGQRATPASPSAVDRRWWQRALDGLERIGQRLEQGRLGHLLLADEDRLLLQRIHWDNASGRAIFLGGRVALAALFPLLALIFIHQGGARTLIEILVALALGLLLPKFLLGFWANRLRAKVEDELPLLVDLLNLLQGVGMSMDQSLQSIADRFYRVLPVLGQEIRDANLAYTRGRSRTLSLRRLAESFGNDDLHSLVRMILQVHEHGGAVQEPLRQFADRLREQRKMSMKEKIGKLSVKMTMVMMVTLLPALMLVLAGPAVISLISSMAKIQGH